MERIHTYDFTDKFLDQLADYIEEQYIKPGKDLSRVAIVFGGKRPALFLKRELAKRLGSNYFPPPFFTIDEFINYSVRKTQRFDMISDLDSCYLLFQLAGKHTPEILKGREDFARFLPWAREILAFIDQLDLENVAEDALRNIQANAEIGYSVPDDINKLLEHIVVLRQAYHLSLKDQNLFSRGSQYLYAAKHIPEFDFDEFDHVLFCNFFYFNHSEEAIVKHLHAKGKAVLFFQGDQRKWPVLERISRKFECQIVEGEKPTPTTFDLNLYAGFDLHSQVGLVREILKKINHMDRTVIVLPNPDHIVPLLSELAQHIEHFNISMGYPLKRSSLYSLCDFIFKTQLSRKENRYYAKDYLKVLRHPFVKNLNFGQDQTVTRMLIHKIEEILTGKERTSLSGSLFFELSEMEELEDLYVSAVKMCQQQGFLVKKEELQEILQVLHKVFFQSWQEVNNFKVFVQVLEEFLDLVSEKSFMRHYPLNINIATKMYAIKDELEQTAFHQEPFAQEDIFHIFDSKVSREIVAFVGSPLKGLQILGLFETRSLNFDHVVVMDVNEGSLPNLNIYEPLIPREVMISLNLDRLELEEEIQRYQFMRLISSAKDVHLVYQESKDKEKSRFVEELIWEEEKKSQQLNAVAVKQASFEVKVGAQLPVIEKTPEMVEFLKNHRYSASSINMYVRNPMDFYYNYCLGLREQEDLLDEPEARHIGTFVHQLLEEAYQPFLNKTITINDKFRNRVAHLFDERFTETFGRSMKSDSFLLRSIILERLKRFLDQEEKYSQAAVKEIMFLENRFSDTISLSVGDVGFSYVVDRIDRMRDGTIMIIDYKTGGIDQMPKKVDQILDMDLSREAIKEHVRSFQIPLYFHFLNKKYPDEPINAALYNLRTLKIDRFFNERHRPDRETVEQAFMRCLDFIVSEICDPNVPFVADYS